MTDLPPIHDHEAWQQIGSQAYHNGEPGIPTLSVAVRAAIANLPVGGGAADVMRAWQAGWSAAYNADTDVLLRKGGIIP